jgi:hypothetical protein
LSRFQAFSADLLQRAGALVEAIDPEALEVIAPEPLQQALGIPEFCRLGFGATMPEGAERVGIESDWLERFANVVGERGRSARRVVRPSNPPLAGVDRLLEHELALPNAVYRLRGVAEAWTRYLILVFRFTALSDEKREGVLKLGINLATGAMLDATLERLMTRLEAEPETAALPDGIDLPPLWQRERVLDLIRRSLPPRLMSQIEPFAKSLERRLARDETRLYGYHDQLFQDAMARLAAAESDERQRREQQRGEAIEREYRARLDDLRRKYALCVTTAWVQTLEIAMPVQRLDLLLRRRKGERLLHLDWNPLARRLEPLPCDFGDPAEHERLVCDDALHLVTPSGLAACAGCGKTYCRACYRKRCPRCGNDADGALASSGGSLLPQRQGPGRPTPQEKRSGIVLSRCAASGAGRARGGE